MRIGEKNECSNVEKTDFTPLKETKLTLHGELKKIKTLGWKYFWNYYKWWTIGLVFFMSVTVIMVHDIIENKRPCLVSGAVYNCETKGSADDFAKELAEYFDVDPARNRIKLLLHLKCEADSLYAENGQLAEMKLEAQITARELDFIIGDELLMKSLCIHAGDVPYLVDLREALSEELYAQISEQCIWYSVADGEKIPAVIDVSESKINDTLLFTQKPAYLGIVSNAQHKENVVKILEYVLAEDEHGA